MHPPRRWHVLESETVLDHAPWIRVVREKVLLPSGVVINDFFLTPGRDFSTILALTSAGEVLVVRQYKHGLRRVILEFPGGYLDTPEDPLACAKRKLCEETGFEARSWKPLGALAVDANRSPNRGHFFLARDLTRSPDSAPHPTDDLDVLRVPIRQVPALLNSGELATQAAAAGWGLAASELLRS